MPLVERDLSCLTLPSSASSLGPGHYLTSFSLISSSKTNFQDFTWTLEFPIPQAYRILVTGPDRPRPPHDNLNAPPSSAFARFKLVSLDRKKCTAEFDFPEATTGSSQVSGLTGDTKLRLRLNWAYQVWSDVIQVKDSYEVPTPIISDLAARPLALTTNGVIRHWQLTQTRLHLGLGEKAAPLDLTGRSFSLHAADSAWYDTWKTDPLYKHTPFLISAPRPEDANFEQGITFAIAHGTNSFGIWDLGTEIDYPSGGWSKRYIQDYGGLEEWVMFGHGVQGVVQTFAELAGKPMLVGRDWLGYLASTMLLADKPNAQELLEEWPAQCAKHGIPCSAMHFSSGFTVDENTGDRWVFHMNKSRYPDFAKMVQVYHQAGMKVVPNVKPYLLRNHPASNRLIKANALYHDPITKGPSKQNLWSSGEGMSGDGSWTDFTAPEARKWWAEGVQSLIDLGVDGMWDDNSEFYTRDDALLFQNDIPFSREVPTADGPISTGLIGRLTSNEIMNKVSHDTLISANPSRRPFIVTRSGNIAAFKYACSTWTGDNLTSWHNLQGSQFIQLNSGLSLIQSTGSDVGGFTGDAPSAELLVRWTQLGVTHARFCIHSSPTDLKGRDKLTTPWMFPEMIPIIREHIKWRYMMLPFINNLMWLSHLNATPTTTPLFYGSFASDPELYSAKALLSPNAWMGVGQLLVAPQLQEGAYTHDVYFPKASKNDTALYFNLNAPYETYKAGRCQNIPTPIEHGGLFAREGAVIPIGKPKATVTATSGEPITHTDGVDVILEDEGGQVGLDDWRGVLLFPTRSGDRPYEGSWTEDDGISAEPGTCYIELSYTCDSDTVKVDVKAQNNGFTPLWNGELHVILPMGDERKVAGAEKRVWNDRSCWLVKVSV